MKNTCSIVKDLLPLYTENMVSADTAAFVHSHLQSCADCQAAYQTAGEPAPAQQPAGSAPLQDLRRQLRQRKLRTIALTALLVAALCLSAFAVMSAPVYLPYAEGRVALVPLGENGLVLAFDKEVAGFAYTLHEDPDTGAYRCEIEAWTSLWGRWFAGRRAPLSTVVQPPQAAAVTAVYLPNDGSESIQFATYDPRQSPAVATRLTRETGIALPRLSLGYYFMLALAALVVLAIAALLAKNRPAYRALFVRLGLYPAAYLLAHLLVAGPGWATYSLTRDLALILFVSILLYTGLLLAYNCLRQKKEQDRLLP